MKFATYTHDGTTFYGAITDEGAIPLSPDFPHWPTLKDVIAAKGLSHLTDAANGRKASHKGIGYLPPIPQPDHVPQPGVYVVNKNSNSVQISVQLHW